MTAGAATARITKAGSFELHLHPVMALPLFTPEGERIWVEGWDPTYHSGATDEVGAVWSTSHGARTTWVTVARTEHQVAYARVSDNGTAGLVSVTCEPLNGGGTLVQVTYDLTATSTDGVTRLEQFAAAFDDMLKAWRVLIDQRLSEI
jgi:hypothetical protein